MYENDNVIDVEFTEVSEESNCESKEDNDVINNDTENNSEFVNNDNTEAFKMLGLKSKLSDIQAMEDDINKEQRKVFKNPDDDFDPIDNLIKDYTEDQLKDMSYDEINKLLVDEDGNPVEFALSFGGDSNKLNQFKKDFVILRKQALDTFDKLDSEMDKINADIAESQEEFDKYIAEYGNLSTLIRKQLIERLDTAKDEHEENVVKQLIESFDYGLSLDNLKKYCSSYKGNSIIGDYRNEKQSMYIYKKYQKVVKSLNIKTDLTKFINIEKKFLPNEYQSRPNIFIFSVIHFIASWNNKNYTKASGLFITQFSINIKNLYYDKFDNESDKEQFINNIKDVIHIIG